ncbi:hypothetical protein CC2G_012565 [Coprinopsis cinerea AmutBmut pab1-1]|nr:hypothetical protein CC2G_012565 [Coprinopsis cinerea AmutBmut pab1-1]
MPPRPAIKSKESRPVSAIYLGSSPNIGGSANNHITQIQHSSSSSSNYLANGVPPNLPDLPEPPSPSSSIGSEGSGLPSPPATNSTGSGSTGDPGSIALRQRPLSFASDSSASTSGSSHRTLSERTHMHTTPSSIRSSSRQAHLHDDEPHHYGDHDLDDDTNDLDGDDTARLDRRLYGKSSNDNKSALQRVMSLTQRNRMAIDKLSRLGSPSPSTGRPSGSRSPSQASSVASSSRLRQARTIPTPPTQDHGASGSETEREGDSVHTHSSSHSYSSSSHASSSRRPITPSSGDNDVALVGTSSPYSRLRHISAPDSPQKARLMTNASGSSNASNSPTRRRKRSSIVPMTPVRSLDGEDDDHGAEHRYTSTSGYGRDRARDRDRDTVRDITQSALAAVAQSRRSPTGTRRRGALPREFREGTVESADTRSVASEARSRKSVDFEDRSRLSLEPVTPYRSNIGRSSTLREVSRSGGSIPRWGSEDYHNAGAHSPVEGKRERRQTLRGGSAESALFSPGGRTLVGEGLRAAGLTPRRDEARTIGPSSGAGDIFRERDRRVDHSPLDDDRGKRRVFTPARELTSRAATSMADYRTMDRLREQDGEEEQRQRLTALRNHRSTYSLSAARDHDPPPSRRSRDLSLTRAERDQLELDRASLPPNSATFTQGPSTATTTATAVPKHLHDRHSTASPFGSRRMVATPAPGASSSAAEHVRILMETLSTFEGNLSKLPTTAVNGLGRVPTAAELLKHAENVVYTTERINTLMRTGTNRALEAQINAEVDSDVSGTEDMLTLWKKVGGEYREGLRASDELVRALTSFLIDVGLTMRRLSPSAASEYGSPAGHGRSLSLDEEGIRQHQRAVAEAESSSGRLSVDSATRREREETMRRLSGGYGRESSLGMARASPAINAFRERERNVYDTPSPASSGANKPLPSVPNGIQSHLVGSARRLFTPSQQRERQLEGQFDHFRPPSVLRPSDSQRTLQGTEVEPSPTPRTRTLTRTSFPPEQARRTPMSKPSNSNSESSSHTSSASGERNVPSSVGDRHHERRKPSVASIVTVRGSQPPSLPNLTAPGSATTSLTTHTVSNSSEQTPPLLRTDSGKSARSTVTFSRPSPSSVTAALSGIQQQAREDERKRRGTSMDNGRASSSDQSQSNSPLVPKARLEIQQQPKKLAAIALARGQSNEGGSDLSRRRTTLGLGTAPRLARASLDGAGLPASTSTGSGTPFGKESTAHAADRHAASTVLPRVTKERRRTVTDIWPRE